MKIIISELPLSPWWWQGVPAYDDNPAMQAGTIPNQSLVVSERNMLITILKGLDVDIFESPFPKKLDDKYLQHDFIYIRDQFISDQNGNAVYGPGKYDRQYAVNNGVAGYSKTLEAAQQDQRVVGNPLVIKGVATSGTNRTDISISNADVSRLDAANRSSNILKDCRVLILLD